MAIRWICRLLRCCTDPPPPPPPPPVVRFRWQLTPQSYIEGVNTMARLTNEQRVEVTVLPETAAGNPAPIDGAVVFASTDDAVARVEQLTDTTARVIAVGPGVTQITAVFDADLGEGVRQVNSSEALEVVPAEAVVGRIVFGEPELNPPTP